MCERCGTADGLQSTGRLYRIPAATYTRSYALSERTDPPTVRAGLPLSRPIRPDRNKPPPPTSVASVSLCRVTLLGLHGDQRSHCRLSETGAVNYGREARLKARRPRLRGSAIVASPADFSARGARQMDLPAACRAASNNARTGLGKKPLALRGIATKFDGRGPGSAFSDWVDRPHIQDRADRP